MTQAAVKLLPLDEYLSPDAKAFMAAPASVGMPYIEDIYSITKSRAPFVIYTDAQREAKVAEELAKIGVTSYMPKVIEWRPRTRAERDQNKPLQRSERPLIPRYLIVELPISDMGSGRSNITPFGRVLAVAGVRGFLGNQHNPIPIPQKIVEVLREREKAGDFNKTIKRGRVVGPTWAENGREVFVKHGCFSGFMAVIERCLPKDFVDVWISMFGRTTLTRLKLADIQEP